MEALNGVVSKTLHCKPSTAVALRRNHPGSVNMNHPRLKPYVRSIGINNCGYQNKEHTEYYGQGETKEKEKRGWNRVSAKKKVKLFKGLVKDLSTFSELGFGLSFDCDQGLSVGVNDKSLLISQAAEVLLAQLKQLKLEEEKQKQKKKKKKEKQDKKKCKKADDCNSSSSSESSDSECDKVVDMKSLRKIPTVQPNNELMSPNSEQDFSNMILEATLNKDASIDQVLNSSSSILNLNQPIVGKRVEVCIGGKCKKAGGPGLIEAFQKAVVGEFEGGEVVGCKCMGKCKSAPNVKVVSNGVDDLMSAGMNHVYVGVGLEDVDLIVARCFDEGSILSTAAVAS